MSITPYVFSLVLEQYIPEPQVSLLKGIIFGIKPSFQGYLFTHLKETGLLHIVVMSGSNITLIGAIILQATSFFSKKISIILTIFFIVLFIIFIGPDAPIIRAGIMAIISLLAYLYGRKVIALYSLAITAFLMAIFNFKIIQTLSFQLSFAATLGIILFGMCNNSSKKIKKNIRKLICSEIRPSLAAQIFTAPIIFLYFKQISFVSLISNILVSWCIGPLMIFGFATCFFGKLNYYLGFIPASISYGLLSYMLFIIDLMRRIPFAFVQF